MKLLRLAPVPIMAVVLPLMVSGPMSAVASKTRNDGITNSVILASVRTKSSSRKNKDQDGDTTEDDKSNSTQKKKSFWPSFGGAGKKNKDPSPPFNANEKGPKKQPSETNVGPFGIFHRAKEPPKKDDGTKEKKDENKSPEQSEKVEPEKTEATPEKSELADGNQKEEKSESSDADEIEGKQSEEKDKSEAEKEKEEGSDVKKGEGKENEKTTASAAQQKSTTPSRYAYVYRQTPQRFSQRVSPGASPGMPAQSQQNQILIATAVSNLIAVGSRMVFIKWLVSKLRSARELKDPEQHFQWECLNDKYYQDDLVWKSVQSQPPLCMGFSGMKWKKIVRKMGPLQEERKSKEIFPAAGPSRTVVVIDMPFKGDHDAALVNFSNMVAFLVSANGRNKKFFGSEPEVILNIQSGGGEATLFALASAEVNRLSMAGYKVTACVDRIAASGGYMIASQANQILAAPFALVGSIGVMLEALNFNEALKSFGVKALSLKAGDMKNPISTLGEVTDKDVKSRLQELGRTHTDFIELCRSKRPELDPVVCDGRVLAGDMAVESGLIDRILTSQEYIFEKISEGDLVMQLHLISPESEHLRFLRVLQILPSIRKKLRSTLAALSGGPMAQFNGVQNAQAPLKMDSISNLVQGALLASMVRRAIQKSGIFEKQWGHV